jgi:hypothetical protein
LKEDAPPAPNGEVIAQGKEEVYDVNNTEVKQAALTASVSFAEKIFQSMVENFPASG